MVSVAFKNLRFLRTAENVHNEETPEEKKITACHAALQDGSSVMLVLRENLELEVTGTHISQHTSTPGRRPKQSALHRPCRTPEFCPDARGGQRVSQALQSFKGSLCLSRSPCVYLTAWELHFAFSLFDMYNDRV